MKMGLPQQSILPRRSRLAGHGSWTAGDSASLEFANCDLSADVALDKELKGSSIPSGLEIAQTPVDR